MGVDENEIRNFLKQFKRIASKNGISVVSRESNLKALAGLGLTKKDRKKEIMTLSVTDYCQGPEPDHSRPGKIWIFGKKIKQKNIYIKLKIADTGNQKIAKCLSFHPAIFPLNFPFKGRENCGRVKK